MKPGFLAKFPATELYTLPTHIKPVDDVQKERFSWWCRCVSRLIQILIISIVFSCMITYAAHYLAHIEVEKIRAMEKIPTTSEILMKCMREEDTCNSFLNLFNLKGLVKLFEIFNYEMEPKSMDTIDFLVNEIQKCKDSECAKDVWMANKPRIHSALYWSKNTLIGYPYIMDYINSNPEMFLL